jgi:small subunit ribosomal protein S8
MVTDLVADMLTRIRNSYSAKHRYTVIAFSKLNWNIARILKQEGFIKDFEVRKNILDHLYIYIDLKYKYIGKGNKPKPILTGIKRISRPGLRVYSSYKNFSNILGNLGNLGIAIISTSEGVMTNFQASKLKKGGEILCFVW